jgi:hypothetical protein
MAIPLSRFQAFISNAVLNAFNAKVELMKTEPAPIKTGKFKLALSGQLIDDLGGLGWNEIEREALTINPGAVVVTVVNDPDSVTTTETLPETTRTTDYGTDSETAEESSQKDSEDKSVQTTTDSGQERTDDASVQVAEQAHGRGVRTTTEYKE